MRTICIIPARGGSKGLPGKNIRPLAGHPLIAWPIAAARNCRLIDKVVLTTDSPAIAEIGARYGAEVPFLRPESISTDTATTEETLKYTLEKIENETKQSFDIAVFLTATDFFRKTEWITAAVEALYSNEFLESAFVATRTHKNFWENNQDGQPERLREWMKVYSNRQVRRPSFREDTGLACASRAHLWRSGKRIGDIVKLIEVDSSLTSLDIHTEFDFFLVEQAYKWFASRDPSILPDTPILI